MPFAPVLSPPEETIVSVVPPPVLELPEEAPAEEEEEAVEGEEVPEGEAPPEGEAAAEGEAPAAEEGGDEDSSCNDPHCPPMCPCGYLTSTPTGHDTPVPPSPQ